MLDIRPMTEPDLDAVLAIEQACFPRPWNRSHFMAEIASEHGKAVVAEKDGCIAGYLCLSVLFDEAEILDIAVDPSIHRSGTGARLMEWACSEALMTGASVIRLEVRSTSTPAISMYERFGFVRCGIRKGYYENVTDAVLMEKYLQGDSKCSSSP